MKLETPGSSASKWFMSLKTVHVCHFATHYFRKNTKQRKMLLSILKKDKLIFMAEMMIGRALMRLLLYKAEHAGFKSTL